MKNLKAGDRVILKAKHPYATNEANPCEGSEWFCEGVVLSPDCCDWLKVKWDNGFSNSYSNSTNCLELVDMEVCI